MTEYPARHEHLSESQLYFQYLALDTSFFFGNNNNLYPELIIKSSTSGMKGNFNRIILPPAL